MIKRNKKDIHKYIVLVFKDIAKCITSSNYCSAGLCYIKSRLRGTLSYHRYRPQQQPNKATHIEKVHRSAPPRR